MIIERNPETQHTDACQDGNYCHHVEIAKFICDSAGYDAARNRAGTSVDG